MSSGGFTTHPCIYSNPIVQIKNVQPFQIYIVHFYLLFR